MLGSPIGTVEFAAMWCGHMAARQDRLLKQLGKVQDVQCRWLLLKYCAEPTCNHILRNVPFHLCSDIADWHDNAIWQKVC